MREEMGKRAMLTVLWPPAPSERPRTTKVPFQGPRTALTTVVTTGWTHGGYQTLKQWLSQEGKPSKCRLKDRANDVCHW